MIEQKYHNRRYRFTPQATNPYVLNSCQAANHLAKLPTSSYLKYKMTQPYKFTEPLHHHDHSQFTQNTGQVMSPNTLQSVQIDVRLPQNQDKKNQGSRKAYKEWLNNNSHRIKLNFNIKNISCGVTENLNRSVKSQINKLQATEQLQACPNHKSINFNIQKNKVGLNYSSIEQITEQKNPYTLITKNQRMTTNITELNLVPIKKPHVRSHYSQQKKSNHSHLQTDFKSITIDKTHIKRTPIKITQRSKNNFVFSQKNQDFTLMCTPEIKLQCSPQKQQAILPTINQPQTNAISVQSFYSQSFRGRRPYNEDRYICEFQQTHKLKDKMKLFNHTNFSDFLSQPAQTKSSSKHCFFGVFDGHGGTKCSQFLQQNLYKFLSANPNIRGDPELAIKQSFQRTQQKFLTTCQKSSYIERSGSCAVVCLILNDKMYFGNVGDSRGLILNKNQVKQITKDHKPEQKNEKLRIIKNGGKIYKDGCTINAEGKQNIRIFQQSRIIPGNLNVSRTIGDIETKIKKYGGLPGTIVPQPQIFIEQMESQISYLLLASDGLFQGLSNQQIHKLAISMLTFQKQNAKSAQQKIKAFTKRIIEKSAQISNDNITVVCALLTALTLNEQQ